MFLTRTLHAPSLPVAVVTGSFTAAAAPDESVLVTARGGAALWRGDAPRGEPTPVAGRVVGAATVAGVGQVRERVGERENGV